MSDKNYLELEEHRRVLINEIVDRIESGEVTFRNLWSKDLSRPQNPCSGAKYNGANRLILGFEAVKKGYKDPRWLTFIQAKKEGFKLRKGSKSVSCEKWIYTKEVKEKNKETGEMEKKVIRIKPFANRFNVFNAELFENIPEYVPERTSDQDKVKILDTLIKSSECEVKIVGQDRAFYMPTEDIIALPLIDHFKDDDSAIGVLLHEMAHSTGHINRLDRENNFSKKSYAREELVAEISAIFLEQDLGLELNDEKLNNHSAYLKSWLQTFKEDPNELFRAVIEAEKSSNRILERYNEQLEKEKKLVQETTKEYQVKFPEKNIIYAEKHENGNLKTLIKEGSCSIDHLFYKQNYRENGTIEKEEIFEKFDLKTLKGQLIGENLYSTKNKLVVEKTYINGKLINEIKNVKKNKEKELEI